ncbi:tripartite tricarboxylate transporter substrate binding protein [Variovorax sp. WS11]|uniref:Bug family tripartite tricarboxylate transporter substrate binding protein n=1 Tax=Variovorax sp. WS11 TaxID=1105204 RepID=UPI0013DAA46D|nr:tripartite tricarboxylate transporter substrate binding protein [Variovorax sp. WS11]NDZ17074.1 tripartite tricarboxylate transporter substrate binding protein [Variovorax sp. WS11]
MRYLAQQMSASLGQQIVVENRSGGAGAVGILAASNAAPDGYTFLFTTTTGLVQVPLITKDPSFDPARSVVPVAGVGNTPIALIAHRSLPANDFPSFLDWARTQEAGVYIGGGGPILEIATAVLAREARVKLVYVPYRGTAPVLQAALGGEVRIFFSTPSGAINDYIKAGKLKVLAVTSAEPSNLVPGAEHIAKYVPGYVQEINFALFAPRGTPAEATGKVGQALNEALGAPGTPERFLNFGLNVRPTSASELANIVARDAEAIRKTLETTPVKFGE